MRLAHFTAAAAATLALSSGVFICLSTVVSETADAAATCSNNDHPNVTKDTGTDIIGTNGAKIRTGDGTACTAVGEAFVGDNVTLYCYHYNGSNDWDYSVDHTQSVSGWVRQDLLANYSFNQCYI